MYLYIVEIPKYKNVITNNIKLENSITNLTPLNYINFIYHRVLTKNRNIKTIIKYTNITILL